MITHEKSEIYKGLIGWRIICHNVREKEQEGWKKK